MTFWRLAWPWWRWALTGLSALGLALSGYLGWLSVSGGSPLGCGDAGAQGCDHVLNSRWSTLGGKLPVSGLAAGAYLAMLVASLSVGPATGAPVRRLAWRTMLVLAGAIAASAVWFTIVQKWIVGAFCPYCMATHITGLLLTALVIWRAPTQCNPVSNQVDLRCPASGPGLSPVRPIKERTRDTPGRSLAPWSHIALTFAGGTLAAILAVCQIVFAPPVVYRGGDSQSRAPAMDPQTVPLIGSPQAPFVVNLLFDYKCPHCQQLHFLLDETLRRYGGKLAFALCPAPLNRQCNPYIPRDVDEFKDSCDLAKVGLAVWVANREAFPAFDHWMFSYESGDRWRPRSLDAAKAKAAELVGQAKFNAALASSWIERYLQTSIRIYADTIQAGNGAIPKLVYGSRWVVPEPNDVNDLVFILQNSLAVPRP